MMRTALHALCAIIVPSATIRVRNDAGSGTKTWHLLKVLIRLTPISVCIICTTVGQYFTDRERRAGLWAIAELLVHYLRKEIVSECVCMFVFLDDVKVVLSCLTRFSVRLFICVYVFCLCVCVYVSVTNKALPLVATVVQ